MNHSLAPHKPHIKRYLSILYREPVWKCSDGVYAGIGPSIKFAYDDWKVRAGLDFRHVYNPPKGPS